MSVDVTADVVIARPRAAVAAFMFDPRHDAAWTSGVVDCKPLQEGLLRTGARVERTSKFLGRRFGYLVEVTAHEDQHFVEMHVTEPFPMFIRYELEDAPGGGTVARIHTRGDPKGFFSLAAPLMAPMVRRSIATDLQNLKQQLESA